MRDRCYAVGAGRLREIPMPIITTAGVLLSLFLAQPPPDQNKTKIPEKGDIIVVKGCIAGSSTLEDLESGRIYRLKGAKALLKQLTKEHAGHVEEVTGELQSSLRMGNTKIAQVGRTRITIGAAEGRNTGAPTELNPVLSVRSFEHTAISCPK